MILLVLVVTGVAANHGDHGHHQDAGLVNLALKNAIEKLDKQFLYLLSAITSMILYLNMTSLGPRHSLRRPV